MKFAGNVGIGVLLLLGFTACQSFNRGPHSGNELSSWNAGPAKMAIVEFVEAVTTPGGDAYVEPSERIAVFDNDGTLWCEQPLYVQAFFIFDRIKALAPEHPEWKEKEPFASVLKGDIKTALAGGEDALIEMTLATHAGMSSDEYSQIAADWIATAKHPETGRPYTEMVYQPMLELLDYLRDNEFKTFIVSGGGIEFMRPWTERVYGIPPEQVIGSSIKTVYQLDDDGSPSIQRLPEMLFIDDKDGKPVGIQQHIGRRPILAFGNSDGDFQMLEWTSANDGKSLSMILHHNDDEREYAYDRESHIGKLNRGLDEAADRSWTIVSMKNDFKTVFAASE